MRPFEGWSWFSTACEPPDLLRESARRRRDRDEVRDGGGTVLRDSLEGPSLDPLVFGDWYPPYRGGSPW